MIDGLPVTTLERTIEDCIAAKVDRRLIERVLNSAVDQTLPDALDPAFVDRARAALG